MGIRKTIAVALLALAGCGGSSGGSGKALAAFIIWEQPATAGVDAEAVLKGGFWRISVKPGLDPDAGDLYVETLLAHTLGHSRGLADDPDPGCIMHANITGPAPVCSGEADAAVAYDSRRTRVTVSITSEDLRDAAAAAIARWAIAGADVFELAP